MADFNVKARTAKDKEGVLVIKRLLELGYDAVAWNNTIFGKPTQANISTLPRSNHTLSPVDQRTAVLLRKLVKDSEVEGVSVAQYQRITIVVDDIADAQSLHSSNDLLRPFDIVAATPGNGKVFAYLCKEADIDVISLDFSRHLPFSIAKKTVDEAVSRGIYFEIKYSPCLHSSSGRRESLTGTKHLIRVLRGRNIIITSGSESSASLRGPYDAVNIGKSLHISDSQSCSCVFQAWLNVIQRGESRKRRHLPAAIMPYSELLNMISNQSSRSSSNDVKRKRKRTLSETGSDIEEVNDNDDGGGTKKSRADIPAVQSLKDVGALMMFE